MKKIIIGSRESVLAMAQTKILQEYIEKNCPGISVEILAMKTTGDSILEKRLEMLERQGIPFEIVPGVSSALAVPAYFGIPATHRDLASSVHIVTGHRREGKKLQINFRALKEAGGNSDISHGNHRPARYRGRAFAGGDEPGNPRGDSAAGNLRRTEKDRRNSRCAGEGGKGAGGFHACGGCGG